MTDAPYRIPAPRPADAYMVAWTTLRRRRLVRRLVVGVLVYSVTSLVVVALAQARLLTGTLLTSLMTNLMMELVGMGTVLGLTCLGLVVVGVRHLLPFMCPRCEQPFFHGLATEVGFVKNCAHCGIAVGTPESSGEAEQPLDVE